MSAILEMVAFMGLYLCMVRFHDLTTPESRVMIWLVNVVKPRVASAAVRSRW